MKVTGSWDILIPLTILGCQLFPTIKGSVVVVTNENWENIIKSNDVVLLNFYAGWCPFSKKLEPIFEEAAARIREQFPEDGRVILGKVNCDDEFEVAERFNIFKYPTLKVGKSGVIIKQEYRGQRSVKAFVQFVERELSDPIKEFDNTSELHDADVGHGLVIGYFISRDHEEYLSYRKVARIYRNDCRFMVGFGEVSRDLHPPGQNLLIFRANSSNINYKDYYSEYSGNLTNFKDLISWVSEKCKPLVRYITFDNAEELTEEGLPLLIAFYNKNDLGPVREFQTVVKTQLADEKRVNFLTADGALFGHPLFHIGKSMDDLPVIAIDSFQHMYVFPKFADIHQPGVLKKFIDDLFTGQHHLDYHNYHYLLEEPSDTTVVEASDTTVEEASDTTVEEASDTTFEVVTPPVIHESKFKELLPSKHRYTLLNRTRDEL